jgi:hypothetical protein
MTRDEKTAAFAIRSIREAIRRIDVALEGTDIFNRTDEQEAMNALSNQLAHLLNDYDFLETAPDRELASSGSRSKS